MEIPKEFLDRMRSILQEEGEWQSFLRSFSEMPKRGIRVNRKKVEEAEKEGFSFQEWKEKWHLEPVFSEKREEEQREFYVEEEELRENGISIGKDPYHEGGLYYIQDPSAMAVVPRMEIRPFDRCLDLCASPGGKSLQISFPRKKGEFCSLTSILEKEPGFYLKMRKEWGIAILPL